MRAYGWTAKGDALVDAEAAVLRAAAADVLADVADKAICRALTEQGITTVSGGEWTGTALKRTLTAPRMIGRALDKRGRVVMRGDLVCPPILDVDTWKAVRAKLSAPTRGGVRKHKYQLLESRKFACTCGTRMHVRHREGRAPFYECRPVADGGCGKVAVVVARADEHVAKLYAARAAEVLELSPTRVATWWTRAAHDTRRAAIIDAVESITVGPSAARSGFDPERITVVWSDTPRWPPSLTGAARATAHDGD